MKVSKISGIRYFRVKDKAFLTQGDIKTDTDIQNKIYEKYDRTNSIIDDYRFKNRLKKSLKNKKFNGDIDKEIERITNNLKKSIEHNKIVRCKEDRRLKFLLSFIEEKNEEPTIKENRIIELSNKYMLNDLLTDIKNNIQEKIDIKVIRKTIYDHKKSIVNKILKEDKIECEIFLDEVKEFLESQFSQARRRYIDKNKVLDYTFVRGVIRNRIINKITQYYILKGKLKFYECTDNITSNKLNEIKANESFKKQLLTAIVAVGARFDALMDIENQDDRYLGGNILTKDIELLKICLGDSKITEEESKELLDIIKKLISNIRHNTVHFKNPKDFFVNNKIDKKDINKINKLKEYLKHDIDNAEIIFTQNLSNLSIAEYLEDEKQKQLYSKLKFNFKLNDNNLFMTPSFSNVYKKGKNMVEYCGEYQEIYNVYKDENIGYKNLLMLVYKYDFISKVNDKILKDAIINVLKFNKDNPNNTSRKNEDQFKYNEIYKIWQDFNNKPVIEFLKQIQRDESNKSSEIKDNLNNKKNQKNTLKNKYSDFIRDIYAFAFAKYYNRIIDELNNTEVNDTEKCKLQCFYDLYQSEYIDTILPFYCLFKLMDNYELSDLQGQVKKYISAMSNNSENNLEIYKLLYLCIELVKITKPKFALIAEEQDDNKKYGKKICDEIKKYIDDTNKSQVFEFYTQNGEKPVYYKGITDFILSGRSETYQNIFRNYKITVKDIEKYKTYLETDSNGKTVIENLQQERQNLHKEIVTKVSKNIERYKELTTEINKYNYLKNKVTFVNFSKIAHLQYQILSRFIGFAVDWERDMYFLFLGICPDYKKKEINKVFDKGCVVGKMQKLLNYQDFANLKEYLFTVYNFNELDKLKSIFNIRNDIAHINFLKYKKKKKKQEYSIINSLSKLQDLMQYDRKKYNAVTKTFIDLLEKENILIKLKQEIKQDTKIKTISIENIDSKKSEHLKNINKILFSIHDKFYIDMVNSLLEYI